MSNIGPSQARVISLAIMVRSQTKTEVFMETAPEDRRNGYEFELPPTQQKYARSDVRTHATAPTD